MEKREFENVYKESDKKYFIIIILLCVALLAMLGLYAIRELTSKDDNKTNNTQTNTNTNNTEKKESDEDKKDDEESIKKEMIWSNREPGTEIVYDVFLKENKLYVNEKIVEENIKTYLKVTLGSDICLGDSYVVVLKKDNTVGALSLDSLVCGNEVQYNEKVNNLENVQKIYSEKASEEMGIEFYNVFADTTSSNKINIRDYLSDK